MTITRLLAPQLRMPTAFGAAPGPRNVPAGVEIPDGQERISTTTFTADVADETGLRQLIPDQCTLRDARLSVQVTKMENLHWFAGRGYNILTVSIPVRYQDASQRVDGQFIPVMWESKADPIITGRDELGFPKIYGEIEVFDVSGPGPESTVARGSWEGTTFFEATVTDELVPAHPLAPSLPIITRRYIPAVGALDTADADYLTIAEPTAGDSVKVVSSETGTGRFEFKPVTWQQIPFQFPIINALSMLTAGGPVSVQATRVEGHFATATNRRIQAA